MNEMDKLIARMGFQLVQMEIALQQAQQRVAELEQQQEAKLEKEEGKKK